MRLRRHKSPRRGLTLLEVLIALSLMGVLLGAMLTFFWQVVHTRDAVVARARRLQIARQVLGHIESELRSCVGLENFSFPIEQPIVEEEPLQAEEVDLPTMTGQPDDPNALLAGQPGQPGVPLVGQPKVPLLVGTRRTITFITARLPAREQYEFFEEGANQPPARHDLTQVSYWLWIDPEETDDDGQPLVGGLMRTEKQTLNQYLVDLEEPLDVRNDLWAPEIGYLEFRYFDGVEWSTQWNVTKGNSLPQLIQVTIGFRKITLDELENSDLDEYPIEEYPYGDDLPHPDRYSVIVRMPAADKFFSSRIQRVGRQMAEQYGVEGMEGLQ